MKLSTALAIISYDDDPANEDEFFEEVTAEKIEEQSRWSTFFSQVYKDTRDGTFWEIYWSRGSTECQDEDIEDNLSVSQVYPKEVTTTVYSPERASA